MDASFGGRAAEASVLDFVTSASAGPSGLVIDGEPGIGKTTLWLAAQRIAGERGFTVLSTRAAEGEAVLAYAALADLLDGVAGAQWAGLPEPQRRAVDRVLLRTQEGPAADHHAVGAALRTIIEELAVDEPVLLAIDDMQWLDVSSRNAVAFAARRLAGRVGVLATLRTDPAVGSDASWLQLPRPDDMRRATVEPLTLGRLHDVVHTRLGRTPSRPAMVRIHAVSGGNPFYALELARAVDSAGGSELPALPQTLAELVRARVGRLGADARDPLLAMACLATPTVEVVAAAVDGSVAELHDAIDDAIHQGIIEIVGQRMRFTHPLVAHGVYADASPARRRSMHRRLAELSAEPELRARHLALATTVGDDATLDALDVAADSAALRGAPAAAAELLDLAERLDPGNVARRVRSAGYHLTAGETTRAQTLLDAAIAESCVGAAHAEALLLRATILIQDGSVVDAVTLLEQALGQPDLPAVLGAQIRVTLSFALLNIGDLGRAIGHVDEAIAVAEELDQPALVSQALGMRVQLGFLAGDGVDEARMQRALDLEDREAAVPLSVRPTAHHALLAAWTGDLDEGRRALQAIRVDCLERGREADLLFVAFNSVLVELWEGRFAAAAAVADDLVTRAYQFSDDLMPLFARQANSSVAAFTGPVEDARRETAEAIRASLASGANVMAGWLIGIAGFLELSLENHQGALDAFAPLLAMSDAAPDATELFGSGFLPDAVEAMIALGRAAEAEPYIARLERNGRRLDRPWALAVGARCRSLALAATGDLKAATSAAETALVHHDRLPMPFERARSQLILGQLQRRSRQQAAAAATLRGAVTAFDELGTPLWAQRARAELARVNFGPRGTAELTPTEQRIADLAASGVTNRDVAAELFISPKTVEANLSRIYRKLGVRSRVELAQLLARATD